MVETVDCVRNIDAIARTEGVDVLLVGSNDSSLELSVQGAWDHSKLQTALKTVALSAQRQERFSGLLVYTHGRTYISMR